MTDEELIEHVLSGEQAPFRSLMERNHGKVYSIVYKILQDSGDAQDATQEIFMKVYQSLSSFQRNSSFSTWLYRIAVNHCMTVLRRKRDVVQMPLEQHWTTQESPEGIAVRHETMMEIEHTIQGLSHDARTVLALRLHAELPFEKIGEVMSIPADTAKVRFFRARLQLKDLLMKQGLSPSSRKERAE
jgi:RNA polymerase sigma factor (sigma-70 family)